MNPPLLVLRSASLGLGRKRLFDQLDVFLAKGERVCLIGRNGTGKSTLMKVLVGLVELDSGERFQQPRTVVSYLPQEPDFRWPRDGRSICRGCASRKRRSCPAPGHGRSGARPAWN